MRNSMKLKTGLLHLLLVFSCTFLLPIAARAEGVAFSDVEASTPHSGDIAWLATNDISTGWVESEDVRTFRGMNDVVRQDMAAFLHRLANYANAELSNSSTITFSDVTEKTPHADDIAWLAATGISTGWEESGKYEFRGAETVKRQDMAAFLYRLAGSPQYEPTASIKSYFSDVDESTPHYREVLWLAEKGISEGWTMPDGSHEFRGMDTVKRQDMAAFLNRLASLLLGIRDDLPNDEFEYVIGDQGYGDGAYITGYNGSEKNVEVPSKIEGANVVAINISSDGWDLDVERIDLSQAVWMRSVDVSVTGYRSPFHINFGYLPSLVNLETEYASFDEWIDLTDCPSLRRLYLSDGSYFRGGLSYNGKSLEELMISICGFSGTFNIGDAPKLRSLGIYQNPISELKFGDCPSLERLDVRYTKISSLDIDQFPNLKELICIDNEISDTSHLEAWLAQPGHTGTVEP